MAFAVTGTFSIPTPLNLTSLIQPRADYYGVSYLPTLPLRLSQPSNVRCSSGSPITKTTSARANKSIRFTLTTPTVCPSTTRWIPSGSTGAREAQLSIVVLMSLRMIIARIMPPSLGRGKTEIVAV